MSLPGRSGCGLVESTKSSEVNAPSARIRICVSPVISAFRKGYSWAFRRTSTLRSDGGKSELFSTRSNPTRRRSVAKNGFVVQHEGAPLRQTVKRLQISGAISLRSILIRPFGPPHLSREGGRPVLRGENNRDHQSAGSRTARQCEQAFRERSGDAPRRLYQRRIPEDRARRDILPRMGLRRTSERPGRAGRLPHLPIGGRAYRGPA